MAISFLMRFRFKSHKKGERTRKKQNHVRDWRIVQHISEQMASNMTLVTLSIVELVNQWQATKERVWSCLLRTILHNHQAKKSHSLSYESPTWNSNAVLQDLRQWPQDVQMNWSSFALSHRVHGRNGGQVVSLPKVHGIDTLALDKWPTAPRPRRQKCKLSGGEISSPPSHKKNVTKWLIMAPSLLANHVHPSM